eukprot:RCo004677
MLSQNVLAKKSVQEIVRTIKVHVKNAFLCKECITALQTKLFDKHLVNSSAFRTFILNKTGGVSIVVASIASHFNDLTYTEVAVTFLCQLIDSSGRQRSRVLQKLCKKGGSKALLQVVNAHKAQPRVLLPALSVVTALAHIDRKLCALARLSNTLVTLLQILRSPSVSRELLVSVLSALNALSRSETSLNVLGKRGAIPTLLTVVQKYTSAGRPLAVAPVLKFALKNLHNLCRIPKYVAAAIREAGVPTMVQLLRTHKETIEVQKLALDVLKVLSETEVGSHQFFAVGGSRYIVDVVAGNNADKAEEELLEIVLHLFKFHGLTSLPIPCDEEVTWQLSEQQLGGSCGTHGAGGRLASGGMGQELPFLPGTADSLEDEDQGSVTPSNEDNEPPEEREEGPRRGTEEEERGDSDDDDGDPEED